MALAELLSVRDSNWSRAEMVAVFVSVVPLGIDDTVPASRRVAEPPPLIVPIVHTPFDVEYEPWLAESTRAAVMPAGRTSVNCTLVAAGPVVFDTVIV